MLIQVCVVDAGTKQQKGKLIQQQELEKAEKNEKGNIF
tara:strand:- start:2680 stop:2793 length:114 start_codon:yes stop_codon:yes gene_type:complete